MVTACLEFGGDGYWVFFGTLEILAKEKAIELPLSIKWKVYRQWFPGISDKKLRKILSFFDVSGRFSVNFLEETVSIFCQKLCDISSDYEKKRRNKSEENPKSLRKSLCIEERRIEERRIEEEKDLTDTEKITFVIDRNQQSLIMDLAHQFGYQDVVGSYHNGHPDMKGLCYSSYLKRVRDLLQRYDKMTRIDASEHLKAMAREWTAYWKKEGTKSQFIPKIASFFDDGKYLESPT